MNNFKLDTNEKITSGFKIPEEYFETFSEKVLNQLHSEEPKVIPFYAKYSRIFYSAAAVIVLALSIPIANQLQNNSDEMASNEIENYLTQHSTLSDDDIVNLLDTEDIENIKIDNKIENEALEEALLNNSQIENYITN
jgi:hypothetical protein